MKHAGPGGVLVLALAVALSGCINADAPGNDGNASPGGPSGPLCEDRCAVTVEDDGTRSHESSVARNPLDPDHILVGNSAWLRDETVDSCLAAGTSAETCAMTGPVQLWRHVSFDGGRTWDSAPFPGDVPPDHPLAVPGAMADPNVAFLSDGTAVYIGMYGKAGEAFDIFFARSHDGGLTWPEATIIAGEVSTIFGVPPTPTGTVMDQPFLAVGPDDTLLVTWAWYYGQGDERQDLAVAVSRDGGVTWGDPVLLTDDCICRNGRPDIAPDGTMFMTYLDKSRIRWVGPVYEAAVHVARSDDGGATWETWPLAGVDASVGADLAIHEGTLFVAYADMDDEGRQTTHLLHSEDGGATWADLVLGASEGWGQAIPALDVTADGTTFVVHYETGADGRPWVVATRVAPDGEVVAQDLTDGPLPPHRHQGPLEWNVYGDYSGMWADAHGAVATWVIGEEDSQDLIATFLDPVNAVPSTRGGAGRV